MPSISQAPLVNLISNGDFESVDCSESYHQTCDFFFDGFYGECVVPWGNAYGTSAIMDLQRPGTPNPCFASGHGPEIGRYFAQVHSRWIANCQREAFYAQLSSPCVLYPGQEYTLRFQARTNDYHFLGQSPSYLSNDPEDFWLYIASVQGLENVQGGLNSELDCASEQSSELGRQIIHSIEGFDTDDAWETILFSFTPPSGWVNDQLLFWGEYGSSDSNHNWRNIFFDNFVLTCVSDLTPDPDHEQTGPLSIDFTGDIEAAVSGLEVVNWHWDFGDCIGTSNEQNPSYTYMFPGTYEVCLTITDNRCCTHTVCMEVVTDDVEVITMDIFGCEVCFFTETTPESAYWDFGDGNTGTDISPCHVYEENGIYNVTVVYSVGECEYEDTFIVTIEDCYGPKDYCEEFSLEVADYTIGEHPCSVTLASEVWTGQNPSVISDALIRIHGTLIIDKIIGFLRCHVEMGPHAEIVVNQYQLFEVTSSVLYGCDYLWRSIRVLPLGSLNVSGFNAANPSFICGAWAGVFAHGGARLELSNTFFVSNMVGVYVPPVPVSPFNPLFPTKKPNALDLIKFDKLRFVGGDLLSPADVTCEVSNPFGTNYFTVTPQVSSYAGVLLHDVGPELDLSANTVASSNTYSGLRSGIVALRSNIKVENSRFADLDLISGNNYPYNRGYGIAHVGEGHTLCQKGFGKNAIWSFRNVRVPIFVEGNHVTTKYNRMVQDIHTGIWTRLCKNRNLIMEDNFIQAEVRGINLFQNDPVNILSVTRNDVHMVNGQLSPNACIAIFEAQTPPIVEANYLENDLFFLENTAFGALISQSAVWHNIEDNRVSTTADGLLVINGNETFVRNNIVTGSGSHHGSGISVLASPSTFALCNELRSLRHGLSFLNENIVTRVGLNLFHEDFTNALYYNASGYTGPQINMRNEWCGNTTVTGGFEAKHESEMLAPVSQYMVLSSDGECFKPNPVDPEEDWFRQYSTLPNSLLCHEYDRGREGYLGDLERLIAQDSLDNPEGAPAWLWVQRSDLYRTLMEWPDTTWTGTLYGDFLVWMDTTDVGAWYALEEDIKAILKEEPALKNLRSDIGDTTELWYASIAAEMDIVRNPTSSVQDSLDAIARIDTLLIELDAFALYWDARRALLDSLREEAMLELLAEVDGAPASEDWTAALQVTWRTVLRISLYGPDILQGTLIDDLDAIASECPQTHGKAVYLAGSVLADIATELYTYDCIVAEPLITNADHPAGSSRDLIIYPVPVSDRVVVQLGSDAPDGVIHITHVSGASVLSQRISVSLNELSLSHLPVGTYILTWMPDGDRAVSRMLSIQR